MPDKYNPYDIQTASPVSPYSATNGIQGTSEQYPRGNAQYVHGQLNPNTGEWESEITINPSNHFADNVKAQPTPIDGAIGLSDRAPQPPSYYVTTPAGHFIKESNQHLGSIDSNFNDVNPEYGAGKIKEVFSGSVTQVNPFGNKEMKEILESSIASYVEDGDGATKPNGMFSDLKGAKMPTSPLAPFIKMNDNKDQHMAEKVIFNSYNRTKLPVADVEWRKGFRHIFISRPECYLMGYPNDASSNGVGICDQVKFDDDFATANMRMPHIIQLLSPHYVSGGSGGQPGCNWNYLLSNRSLGMQAGNIQMTVSDNVGKSTEGYTVTPALHIESRKGSTIDLTFQDTKYLEVFETARLWMLYMYKRRKGIFFPPYNGYKITNGFIDGIPSSGKNLEGNDFTRFHPYDRALEYCASLYDIVTNESGDKILYWCKYYGIYPISATPSLNNENNAHIANAQTSIQFKYHYKLENNMKTLVEFNHDAGIVNSVGRPINDTLLESMSWLLKDQDNPNVGNPGLHNYIGAAGMFTGTPFVVMKRSRPDPMSGKSTYVPCLGFMNISGNGITSGMDNYANLGILSPQSVEDPNSVLHYNP